MDNLVCLVTGASLGIGRGVALELARNGCTVYITGRKLATLQEVKDENDNRGSEGEIRPTQCDHAVDKEVDRLFQKIEEECYGRLDLLVNNAYSPAEFLLKNVDKPFWDSAPETWDLFNNVGLRNHYRCAVLASRIMVKRRKGLILNMSSIGGLGYTMTPLYGIGKCAKDRMAMDCSLELRKYNVAFISLWPGAVRTENSVKMAKSSDTSFCTSKEAMYFLSHGESTAYVGKCVVHLLRDPGVMSKSGQILFTADIAREYGLSDDGRRPVDFRCVKDMLEASGFNTISKLFFAWVKLPLWLLRLILNRMAPPKLDSIYQ